MKRSQHVYSTDRYSEQYTKRIERDTKRVIWINVIALFLFVTFGVYVYEIKEFGNNFATFVLRHGNFFAPVMIAFVLFLIIQKVRK